MRNEPIPRGRTPNDSSSLGSVKSQIHGDRKETHGLLQFWRGAEGDFLWSGYKVSALESGKVLRVGDGEGRRTTV